MSLERIDLPRRYSEDLEVIVFDGGTDEESIRFNEPSSGFYAQGHRVEVERYSNHACVYLWTQGGDIATSVNLDKHVARAFEVALSHTSADFLAR